MKRFAFILSALLLVAGIALAQATKGAVISAPVTEFDFGTILEANGKVSHTFIIKNTGDAPLIITRVSTPCSCTTPEHTREPIAPGKEGKVVVTYNPAGLLQEYRCLQQRQGRRLHPPHQGRGEVNPSPPREAPLPQPSAEAT